MIDWNNHTASQTSLYAITICDLLWLYTVRHVKTLVAISKRSQ